MSWQSDGSMGLSNCADGAAAYVPPLPDLLGVILSGTNPYAWRRAYFTASGGLELFPRNMNDIGSSGPSANDERYPDDPTCMPAWEASNNRYVQPGTIAWFRPRFLNYETAGRALEWIFDCQDGPVCAKLIADTGPSTTLANDWGGNYLDLVNGKIFPGKNSFQVQVGTPGIDIFGNNTAGVFFVNGGAGTDSWLGNPPPGFTIPAGSPVTLVGQSAWQEQRANRAFIGDWEARSTVGVLDHPVARSGTSIIECCRPGYTPIDLFGRFNPFSNQFALLWKKSRDSDGATVLTQAIGAGATVLHVADLSSFPINGEFCPFSIRVDGEFMEALQVGSTLQVRRGAFGSVAVLHEVGSPVLEQICEWVPAPSEDNAFSSATSKAGKSGKQGKRGRSGFTGEQGRAGVSGMSGPTGYSGPDHLVVTDGITTVEPATTISFESPEFLVTGSSPIANVELQFAGPTPIQDSLSDGSSDYASPASHIHSLDLNMGIAGSESPKVFNLYLGLPATVLITDEGLIVPGAPLYGSKARAELVFGGSVAPTGATNVDGSLATLAQSDHIHAFALGNGVGLSPNQGIVLTGGTVGSIATVSGSVSPINSINVSNGYVTALT